jgi:hypothetical protein
MEFGASGRRWGRMSLLSSLPTESSQTAPITASDISAVLIAPNIVHVIYVSDDRGRRALRSSLWLWTTAGWRLYFHQGTLTADDKLTR